ncbi:hypothetical protein B0H19DRAFT_1372640 [Mycena capillaripes]|nr:hypothetical protein B0H19DRAFT_1372640 [Mycena capillaripes]
MNSAVSFNHSTTLGAYKLGVLASYILFGVTTTQVYIYYYRFPDDSLNLKALVALTAMLHASIEEISRVHSPDPVLLT